MGRWTFVKSYKTKDEANNGRGQFKKNNTRHETRIIWNPKTKRFVLIAREG